MKIRLSLTIPKWVDGIFAGLILKYRRYRYGQPFRRVLLTGGRYALVDQKDFYRVNDLDWIVKEDYDSIYAVHFLKIPENSSKLISMHRFILNPPETEKEVFSPGECFSFELVLLNTPQAAQIQMLLKSISN